MNAFTSQHATFLLGLAIVALPGAASAADDADALQCSALLSTRNLTITSAELMPATDETPAYCLAKGTIAPQIRYQLQLPLPQNWNGRYLNWGDGGKDGDLDFADHRVAEGYAVSNSNTGHDNGSEPGASFAFNNRAAEIDFGYRAIHVTVNAAKSLIDTYYGRAPEYSYHEGCSTGGRQGLMEAQRFPSDFDGIVAGAPVAFYQELNSTMVYFSQLLFADNFAGNLAYDNDGDGVQESRAKLELLAKRVLEKCDALDGIADGVIDDPLRCDFDPTADLAGDMCADDVNRDGCFTRRQVRNIEAIYAGPKDGRGRVVFKGMSPGSELAWLFVPHAGNGMQPFFPSADHVNYLFYENDPGIAPANSGDITQKLNKSGPLPEWGWWEFDVRDIANDSADFMRAITNATNPDMRRYLVDEGGKLLLYHGWGDANAGPEPVLDYYLDVVATTFGGNKPAADEDVRMFMAPGMYHCRGGPGPDVWDRLTPLVDWVERGQAPDRIVARQIENGTVTNERPLCPYPQQARYSGPAGGANDAANWTADNFTCQ
jgi:hypothetical protein